MFLQDNYFTHTTNKKAIKRKINFYGVAVDTDKSI